MRAFAHISIYAVTMQEISIWRSSSFGERDGHGHSCIDVADHVHERTVILAHSPLARSRLLSACTRTWSE